MDEREPRQGYSDMNERQREGIPALEKPAEPAGGAGREQGRAPGPGAAEAVSGANVSATERTGSFDATSASEAGTDQSTASMMGDPSAIEAGANAEESKAAEANARPSTTARIDPTDLAPAVDEGGADSGGQRSGGDGGMSSITGG